MYIRWLPCLMIFQYSIYIIPAKFIYDNVLTLKFGNWDSKIMQHATFYKEN